MPTTTNPTFTCLVSDEEVDYKTRTVLLLDSRNDLVSFFMGGLEVMAANYKPQNKKDPLADYLYTSCRGFIETVREKSMNYMWEKKQDPEFGIGDMLKNRKGDRRFIINMIIDPKTGKMNYAWVDPDDAKAPMGVCQENTMQTWIDKQ